MPFSAVIEIEVSSPFLSVEGEQQISKQHNEDILTNAGSNRNNNNKLSLYGHHFFISTLGTDVLKCGILRVMKCTFGYMWPYISSIEPFVSM